MKQVDWQSLSAIKEWHDITPTRFFEEIQPLNQPAVIRGLVEHWPAVSKGEQSDLELVEYIKSLDNRQPVQTFVAPETVQGRFNYNGDFTGFNFSREDRLLSDVLDRLLKGKEKHDSPAFYAGAVNIPRHIPQFINDNPIPLLNPSIETLSSLWVGNKTRVAAHWDLPQNIACVVAGKRRFTLFPIEQCANLYVGPLDMTMAGQPSSLVDFHAIDEQMFPNFKKALDEAQTTTLEPGDAIYIPSLWFHHVESLTSVGVMANFWWRDGPSYLGTPFTTMIHALTTIAEMPEQERLGWKSLFDHYIFKINGDPMSHLPEHAKGVFGHMTPENLQRITNFLQHKLR